MNRAMGSARSTVEARISARRAALLPLVFGATLFGMLLTVQTELASAGNPAGSMKPVGIKQYTFRHAATYNDRNDQRPVKILLTPNVMNIKGKCSKDKYDPMLRNWKDSVRTTRVEACNGRKRTNHHPPYPALHNASLQRVANVIAASAGVEVQAHGDATKLVVTNSKAHISFEPLDGVPHSVKAIIFGRRGLRTVRRF